ncbi:hypothetical protein DSO57_1008254 [Entomophthora muscae]|uniref:Uncharacterized protein n=1 Tax=Entomophthora muscae TaxID=34485 RepID=A0ACC2TJ34_9FUNG|nr:hypothetical protein DSO57_1008254 [Entomophthora muscae]
MERWVSFRGQILDLKRLRYTHHRLDESQASWFKEIREALFNLEPQSIDMDHIMHHHTTQEQRAVFETCVVPILRVGFLDEMSFLTWFPNFLLLSLMFSVAGWFFLGSYILALQKISGRSYGEWFIVNWHRKLTLPISRSYFGSQFKESTEMQLGTGQELQSRMTRKEFDLVVLNKGGFPNTVQFDPRELNRGLHHLAQTEPEYEIVDNLDFEPMRTVILIPGNGRTSPRRLASTVRSAAETRYPATHKLIVVVLRWRGPS